MTSEFSSPAVSLPSEEWLKEHERRLAVYTKNVVHNAKHVSLLGSEYEANSLAYLLAHARLRLLPEPAPVLSDELIEYLMSCAVGMAVCYGDCLTNLTNDRLNAYDRSKAALKEKLEAALLAAGTEPTPVHAVALVPSGGDTPAPFLPGYGSAGASACGCRWSDIGGKRDEWKCAKHASAPAAASPPHLAAPAASLAPEDRVLMQQAIDEIAAEVERATRKFPTWPTDPLHALAVLGEEFGELTKAMLQLTYEPHKTSSDEVRSEATQTAAMAIRMLMSLDDYRYQRSEQHEQNGKLRQRIQEGTKS